MTHHAAPDRYDRSNFARVGQSGLTLPRISLGLWHNFGGVDAFETARDMVLHAFDRGVTHFDLANNYGPPPGSAEETLGRVLGRDLGSYRDELVISTKAGYDMWPGPYGNGGSRKYLISSLDQSLKRLGLPYVDVFYHHRPDPETPLEETMSALSYIVRSGRALYVGISNYSAEQTRAAARLLRELATPCLVHQPPYNMFRRDIERDLLPALEAERMGAVVFSPLAQGLLTNRYESGVPEDSRVAKRHGFLQKESLDQRMAQIRDLGKLADARGQSLAQMALAWTLRHPVVSSAVIGASRTSQIDDCLGALQRLDFGADELAAIDAITKNA